MTKLHSSNNTKTGASVKITLATLIAIYSLAMVTSLPGLAISPILDDLQKAFPKVSEFELQMLESLPSLIIIPFILLSGKLSLHTPIRKLVIWGLIIFTFSSIIYLLPIGINLMLINSALLGVGAGMIIPFTTGLIAHYFSGSKRTQQLGIISGISNLSLVLATAIAGYLANIEWHLSFLVYSISIVSLILTSRMAKTNRTKKEGSNTLINSNKTFSLNTIKTDWPISLMIFYFVITIIVLSIPMNLSLFMAHYKIGSNVYSGVLLSLFFLSVMLPGFFINKLISGIKDKNNLIWIGIIILGTICVMVHSMWSIVVGVILIGLGYGVIQPLIYDRTSENASISRVTFHLSLVMAMNYLAIILYPFIQNVMQKIASDDVMIPMYMSLILGISYWIYYLWKVMHKN
ncbi:MFS transporter [Shewanella sp. D64]|uniref:MFS transporter n=1 Tax=unclassified Shewanella TaxID=196818 RepID=UPI0022BA1493|nr:MULTISPECIES: MFS transporter [unclassified Shewanella]MEC4726175.1 MFS transporter [Shewanella sp. D64]MEC4737909.1 MFS transporter [Shewanella sp. E94]WBJ96112.1 MFS transporter [Shewanella sp. MTB7]